MNEKFWHDKVEARIEFLLNSKEVSKDINFLKNLQSDQAPHLSNELLEKLVVEGIINHYEDRTLDFLWWQYCNSQDANWDQTKKVA